MKAEKLEAGGGANVTGNNLNEKPQVNFNTNKARYTFDFLKKNQLCGTCNRSYTKIYGTQGNISKHKTRFPERWGPIVNQVGDDFLSKGESANDDARVEANNEVSGAAEETEAVSETLEASAHEQRDWTEADNSANVSEPVNDISKQTISLALSHFKTDQITEITLEQWLNSIGSEKNKCPIENIRAATDGVQRKQLKSLLPVAAVGKFKDKITNANYEANSANIFIADIDGLPSQELHEVKEKAKRVECVIAVFNSPSGNGLKAIINVGPIRNDAHYKEIFEVVKQKLLKIDSLLKLDESRKDIRGLCYESYDPEIYINWNAKELETVIESQPYADGLGDIAAKLDKIRTQTQIEGLGLLEEDCCGIIIGKLAKAVPGGRHQARLEAGKLAGGYVSGGLAKEGVIWAVLVEESNRVSNDGITNDSELKTLRDSFNNGLKHPITPEDFRKVNCPQGVQLFAETPNTKQLASPTNDVRDGTATTRPLTELGNTQRLHDKHVDDVKYIGGCGFLHWKGDHSEWDPDGAQTRLLAAALPQDIYKEGEQYLQDATRFANWSRASQSKKTIDAAVSLLKDFPDIRVPLSVIDGNEFLAGLDNASHVIDLKKGIVRPAERSDYVTKSLQVSYLGQIDKAKRWLQFLDEIFFGDKEIIRWLQKWCGYSLTGSTSEQCFLFCYGFGANGKSVFIDTLGFILGDYARAIATETLTDQKRAAGGASPDLAALIGARIATTTETEEGVALAESLIKALTGGDTLITRKLYQEPIQFKPQFKIMMSGNHRPIIRGNDDGIWRRVKLLPFTKTFKGPDCDINLTQKLQNEAPHILAWMVEGCLAWQREGLGEPDVIKAATNEYREDQDLIGQWLEQCCEVSAQHENLSSALYSNYTAWCDTNGLRSSSNTLFSRRLKERGFMVRKSNNKQFWMGITTVPLLFDATTTAVLGGKT